MSDETWARVSLRITSPRLAAHEIARLMGEPGPDEPGPDEPGPDRSDGPWATDLTGDAGVALDEQLRSAKNYLRDKAPVLRTMPDADIGLLIGWTPRNPQDGIILDTEFIALLSAVRCHVLLDTYLD